ncbi:glycosyltransferase family 2 protein [Candidatus Poribacteria bacterium]|nr:glycosyltransferase family 2 protein [Candidatus Poribacteria bacterium]
MISVIIPVYNSESTLENCLNNIFMQNYTDYEVIVVDDYSKDNSKEISLKFNCKLIELDKNKGAAAARNRGVKEAKGEIICFTDSDCLVPKDWLNKIVKHFEDKDVGAVGGGYSYSAGNSDIEKFAFLELAYRRKDFQKYVHAAVSNNFACRKDIFEKLGGFPEYFKGAGMEEIVFTFALSRKYKILWDKDNGVGHFFHDNLKDYLKQQYSFAYRAALVTVFIPAITSIEIFRHRNNFLQLLSSLLLTIFLLTLFFFSNSPYVITLMLLFFLLFIFFNNDFIRFIDKDEPNFIYKYIFKYLSSNNIPLIYLRNIVWIMGFVTGIGAGLKHKKKDLSKVWLETYK